MLKFFSFMLRTSKTHSFFTWELLGHFTYSGNLMRIKVTSVHFDLNVDLHLVNVDDVASPTVKLSDAKHHASLLSSFYY